MTNVPDWSSADDPRRRLGRRVEFHARIGSTNDRAWERLRRGDEGTAVVAELQTAGRGRHGRTWSSPAGVNLMVSVGFRPMLESAPAWLLTAAAALAAREACRSVLPSAANESVSVKWPNDVVDAAGYKLAGLLLETSLAGERVTEAVVGMGMNVNWPRAAMPPEIAERATSLIELAGEAIDRVALLRVYLSALAGEVASLEAAASPLERYREASWLTGREVSVSTREGIVGGLVIGIGSDGSLELGTPGSTVSLGHGDVVRVGLAHAPAELPA